MCCLVKKRKSAFQHGGAAGSNVALEIQRPWFDPELRLSAVSSKLTYSLLKSACLTANLFLYLFPDLGRSILC